MVKQPFIWVFLFLYMAISAYVILNLAGTPANNILLGKDGATRLGEEPQPKIARSPLSFVRRPSP